MVPDFRVKKSMKPISLTMRYFLGVGCCLGLAAVYLLQDMKMGAALLPSDPEWRFIAVKSFRFFLNDVLSIGLIWSLFPRRGYLITALVVQIFGLVFFLIPYFILKIGFGLGDIPLVSFLHRLILNPLLLLLLIPSFWIYGPPVKRHT